MRMDRDDDDAAERDDGDFRGPATDVDDEAARRLRDREAGTDRRGHRLLDEPRPARTGVECGVLDGALLHFGDAGRDAEQHPRSRDEPDPVVHPVHEVLDHLLGDVEVADDAVAQRSDRDDVRRGTTDHPLRLRADGEHALGLGIDRDDGRLAHDDPAVADMDQGVGGPEVDTDIAGEESEQAVEHGRERILVDTGVVGRVAGGPPGRDEAGVAPMSRGPGSPRSLPEGSNGTARARIAGHFDHAYTTQVPGAGDRRGPPTAGN